MGRITICVPADWTAPRVPAPAAADPNTAFDAHGEGTMAQTACLPQNGATDVSRAIIGSYQGIDLHFGASLHMLTKLSK